MYYYHMTGVVLGNKRNENLLLGFIIMLDKSIRRNKHCCGRTYCLLQLLLSAPYYHSSIYMQRKKSFYIDLKRPRSRVFIIHTTLYTIEFA